MYIIIYIEIKWDKYLNKHVCFHPWSRPTTRLRANNPERMEVPTASFTALGSRESSTMALMLMLSGICCSRWFAGAMEWHQWQGLHQLTSVPKDSSTNVCPPNWVNGNSGSISIGPTAHIFSTLSMHDSETSFHASRIPGNFVFLDGFLRHQVQTFERDLSGEVVDPFDLLIFCPLQHQRARPTWDRAVPGKEETWHQWKPPSGHGSTKTVSANHC